MKIFGPKLKESRSASMQLSINAIVILVLAMAILGLGLAIVKGIQGRANDFIDFPVDMTQQADATNPIANIQDDLSWGIGKEQQVGISFFNKASSDCSSGAKVAVVCTDQNGDSVGSFSILQGSTAVGVREVDTLKARITPDKTSGFVSGTTYACDIQVKCGSNSDVVEKEPVFIKMT